MLLSMAPPPLVDSAPQLQLLGFGLFYLSVMLLLLAVYLQLGGWV